MPKEAAVEEKGRRLKNEAHKRLTAQLEEAAFDVLEDLDFYPLNDSGDVWSGYCVLELDAFKVILSVKAPARALSEARGQG